MSNEKRAPGNLGFLWDYTTQIYQVLWGFKIHYKDPLLNNPVFHGK